MKAQIVIKDVTGDVMTSDTQDADIEDINDLRDFLENFPGLSYVSIIWNGDTFNFNPANIVYIVVKSWEA